MAVRRDGNVEIIEYDTEARCTACNKSLIYCTGTRVSVWNQMLKAFVIKHNMECQKKKAAGMS